MRDEQFGRGLEPIVGINAHAGIIAEDSNGNAFYKLLSIIKVNMYCLVYSVMKLW